jgi:integrase
MSILPKAVSVKTYVRHKPTCKDIARGEFHQKCACTKWFRYSAGDKQHRVSAGTRTWSLAVLKAAELESRLNGNREESKSTGVTAARPSIEAQIQTFIAAKEAENIQGSTIRKLKYQLNLFLDFMSAPNRLRTFCDEITAQDVLDFRNTWEWGDLTRIKAQQNLKGFLNFVRNSDAAHALKTIKETKEGKKRRKPKPLSESDIVALLKQARKLPQPKADKMSALIRCMVSTGLSIIDAVQLERAALERAGKTKVLKIERQKTGKSATIPLNAELLKELLAVLNGNPTYVFWHGAALADSETKRLQGEMRELMRDAGIYIEGNVFHRFRDTAVDFWLGAGWSMTDIAVALGDTTAIVERHYKDWASERMEARLSKLPVRSWA